MKRITSILLVMLLVFGLLAGCSTGDKKDDTPDDSAATDNVTPDTTPDENEDDADQDTAPTELSGTVSTNGSTSVEKVIGALIESFEATNSGVTVTYDPTGSGSGIKAALEGSTDIGLSSRGLKDAEIADGLEGIVFALDGIAIVIHPDNPVENLTLEQIAGLATGEIANWSEVGGDDQQVVFIGREAGSGTRDGFESIVGVEDECAYAQEQTSTGAVMAAVASNENAIGYISLASVSSEVKAITVEGIECSEATVLDGSYAVQRPFLLVLNGETALSAEAQAFIDFIQSDDATEIISDAGAVQYRG